MRTFGATIKEKDGAVVNPTYMADDDFWRWNDPKTYLIKFWGLMKDDVKSCTLYELKGNNMNKKEIIWQRQEWAPEKMTKVCLENGYSGKIYYNPMRITKADADEFMKKKKIIWQSR